MAEKIVLDGDPEIFSKLFGAYLQSGNISFLLGSGASMPAIQVAGNIEAEINELITANQNDEANLKALSFIEDIEQKNTAISAGFDYKGTEHSLSRYVEFLTAVDHVLFERKNLLLPRQANVFTTNYDIFIEEAASKLSSLILNDGFDRASSLSGNFPFTPERFFDRTYRSGQIYTRQAEVPTVNLIPFGLGVRNQPVKQSCPYALPARRCPYIDADLSDASSASRVGNRRKRRPAGYRAVVCARDKPSDRQVSGIPILPDWWIRHEGRQAGGKTFSINCPYPRPVMLLHLADSKFHARLFPDIIY